MNLKQIRAEINERLKDEQVWTDEEIRLFIEGAEENIQLGIYKNLMVEHAAKIIVKQLKKKRKLLEGKEK